MILIWIGHAILVGWDLAWKMGVEAGGNAVPTPAKLAIAQTEDLFQPATARTQSTRDLASNEDERVGWRLIRW